MRIALVTSYDPYSVLGGQERMIADLAAGLGKKKVSAEVISLSKEESRRWSRFGHLPALQLLSSRLGNLDSFDLVHANGWASHAVFAKNPKPPVLVTLYGTVAQYAQNVRLPAWHKLYLRLTQERFEREACSKSRHLASLCRKQAQEMEEFYGCEKGKVVPINCGIDTSLFYPRKKAEARRRMGFGQYGKVVLACGRMSVAHKGFDILLKLAGRMDKNSVLVVNGSVPERLRGMMKPNMVARTTSLADMPWLYSAADAFVHPSRYEGFGLATAEAMACGTPAVAFDTGAARELIGRDEGGFLIRSVQDESGFVEAALLLLTDAKLAIRAGKAAGARASEFGAGKMVREYLDYYGKIISSV